MKRHAIICRIAFTLLFCTLGSGALSAQGNQSTKHQPPLTIEAAKLTILHKQNRATFTGDVHLTRGDFELFSDKLVAHYRDHSLERAVATGHVRIRRQTMRGHSASATLNQAANTITLAGHAVLEQDGNVVKGETIIHDLKANSTRVQPAKHGRTEMIIQVKEKPANAAKSHAGQSNSTAPLQP